MHPQRNKMKLITSTHYNRPHCTQAMIAHLLDCEKINEYHIIFFIEPGCKDVSKIIENCNLNKTIHYNTSLLGCWTNKKQALDIGFESADFIIHLEDDVLLSKDALHYFEWGRKFSSDIDRVATITAYNRFNLKDYIERNYNTKKVRKRAWYNSTAWAIHKNTYQLLDNWTGEDKDLLRQLHQERNLYELYPCLSRANNIGHCNGVNSSALEILKLVKNKAFAPIGLSKNGEYFVSSKESYQNNIQKQYDGQNILNSYPDPVLVAQLEKCKKYDFETQLITNVDGDEFVKLDNENFKSRNNKTYKDKYFLETWAGSLDIMETDFEYDSTPIS